MTGTLPALQVQNEIIRDSDCLEFLKKVDQINQSFIPSLIRHSLFTHSWLTHSFIPFICKHFVNTDEKLDLSVQAEIVAFQTLVWETLMPAMV